MGKQKIPKNSKNPKSKKLRKVSRFEALALIVIVSLLGVAGWYAYQRQGAAELAASVTAPQTSRFYYTDHTDKVNFYNPATGEQTSTKLPLPDSRYIVPTIGSTNMSVQVTDNGQRIFYASVKPTAQGAAEEGGEGYPEAESYLFSMFANGQETKILELKADPNLSIEDWIVTPDGSKIYYTMTPSTPDNSGSTELHVINVADKKDTLIKDGFSTAGNSNPLFLTPDGMLMTYSAEGGYSYTEHKYADGNYTKRTIQPVCDECSLEWPQAISPDGSKVLFEESTSGDDPSYFSYYVLDLSSDKATRIAGPLKNVQRGTEIWSPDGNFILHDTGPFGDSAESFVQQLEVDSLNNSRSIKLIKDKLTKDDNVTPHTWSPDGHYIVYSHNDKVRFYNVKSGKTLDHVIQGNAIENFDTSDRSFGWY